MRSAVRRARSCALSGVLELGRVERRVALQPHVCGGAAALQRFLGWARQLAECGLPHKGQRKRVTLLRLHAGEQKSLGEPGALAGLADEAGGHCMKPGRQ
ncbi:hypothetical protein NDU88_003616 [Pleurodeles waltl]|uniref:Uncharacterized protein n=1 Tax=Pleurodeles waltl TaxID=8319 RepID=A0AAV7M3X6_PLEWA|nr:hypothetical protein NDU88_003616 [Pleurodeles waltl]